MGDFLVSWLSDVSYPYSSLLLVLHFWFVDMA